MAADEETTKPVSPQPQDNSVARAAAARRAQRESAEELIEAGVEAATEAASRAGRSRSPLASLVVMAATVLGTGGVVGLGGWNASSAITAEVQALRKDLADARKENEALAKKFDEVARELVALAKKFDELAATAKAEKHEQRISQLEAQDRAKEKIIDRLLLELENLKKGLK